MTSIVFKISRDGTNVEVEGKDFKGMSCLEKSEKYIRNLGATQKQTMKPEAYQEEAHITLNR